MLNYVRKGEIVRFIQSYDERNGKPKIECYTFDEYMKLPEDKKEVGCGKLSISAEDIVYLWGKGINSEHLERYIESRKSRKNNLEILTR